MASSEAFAELLDAVSEATLVIERNGLVRVANLAAQRLFGRSREQLVGKPAAGLRAEAEALGLDATVAPLARLGDGVSVLSIRDAREQRLRARQAELAAERIHTLMELARVGAWEVDLRSGDAVYSSELLALTGLDVAHPDTGSFFGAVHPDEREKVTRAFERLVSLGEPYQVTFRLLHPDGSWRWFESKGQVERDDSGAPIKVRGLAIDVTERIAAHEAIRRSEESLRAIVDGAPDAIFISSRTGVLLTCNQAGATLVGANAPAELAGRTVRSFLRGQDVERAQRRVDTWTADRPADDVSQWHIQRPDGTIREIEANSVPIVRDGQGQILTLVRDVTEERRARNQLRIADRMVSLGLLAAGLAHEINNPLAAVMANVDLTLRALTGPPEAQPAREELADALRDAGEAAERVRQIVRDLRVFTRVEDASRGPVDIHRVIELALTLAQAELRHRARVVREDGQVPLVLGSEARLGQVLLNLLVNAAQAIPEGDAEHHAVTITTRLHAPGRVAIDVRDTGAGMPRDVLASIFTPFFTTKQAGGGTGLGLAICQRIVTELGGTISCESQVGLGTTFRVILPAADTSVITDAATAPPARAAPRRGRVLIVDDEPLLAAAAERVLQDEHEVTVTTSAAQALASIHAGARYDVILCDLMMPQMTGMDLHAELAQTDPQQAARMIFLTGGVFTPRARTFIEDRRRQCLEKPFAIETLRAAVNGRISLAD